MHEQLQEDTNDRPMNIGVKIAKNGYSVASDTQTTDSAAADQTDQKTLEAMVAGISQAFIIGARDQLFRYQSAVSPANENVLPDVFRCLHESLNLLEDLDTLSWYTQVCGETHNLNRTIRHMRNHARHDIRENIDHVGNQSRIDRAKKLGVNEHLMVHIGFDRSGIKMGKTFLSVEEINSYIDWADEVLLNAIRTGIKNGRITGVSVLQKGSAPPTINSAEELG